MRHVAALLLILLVPGLLLPAGMWLHVCRCERQAIATSHSCCHSATAAPGTARACCRHGARHDAPTTPDPVALRHDCGCTWIALPNLPEPPTPPPLAFALPPALTPPLAAIALPAVWIEPAAAPNHPRPRLRAPPPPGIDRNLPLRL